MDVADFMLEEYRQLYAEIHNYQEAYTKLERLSFAGSIVAYGFLIVNHCTVPSWAWWSIPALLGIGFLRCFSYYWLINMHHAAHLKSIETAIYGSRFVGFQTSLTTSPRFFGRKANIATSSVQWLILIAVASFASGFLSGRIGPCP